MLGHELRVPKAEKCSDFCGCTLLILAYPITYMALFQGEYSMNAWHLQDGS